MTTILLVDDKQYNLDDLEIALKDLISNIKVFTANDGSEAIKIIQEEEIIDVVITDLIMETTGMAVLDAAHIKDPLIPVIIVTANENALDREKAYKKGAFDCIGRNHMGNRFIEEIVAKTKNAIEFRKSTITIGFLKKYFDPSIYEEIENNQKLLIPQERIITVVFWDIRGFSKLSDILRTYPQLISGFLREYLEAASKIIFENYGVLDKFIGDGVMALFGSLGENKYRENDAVLAVSAAVSLRQSFGKIYLKWKAEWAKVVPNKIDIGLGCGIHSGPSLVGNLGTSFRDHFTAVGTNVNLAARLENSAKKGQILISSTTKGRIDNTFVCTLIETLENIKNIAGEYDVFEVVS